MAWFHCYRSPSGRPGWLLDVQSDLMWQLSTCIVVPLLPRSRADTPQPARGLNPLIEIEGEPHVMMTEWMAAVSRRQLRGPAVSLVHHRDDITRAIEVVFSGV